MGLVNRGYPNLIGKVFKIESHKLDNCTLVIGKYYVIVHIENNVIFFQEVNRVSHEDFIIHSQKTHRTPFDFEQVHDTKNIVGELQVTMKFELKQKKRLPQWRISDVVIPLLGKKCTSSESDTFVAVVNRVLQEHNFSVTKKELLSLFYNKPTAFKYIFNLDEDEDGYYFDIVVNEIHNFKDIKCKEDVFDFSVSDIQISIVRKLIKDYHGGIMHKNDIIKVLCSQQMLYFESFDYSISDTFVRGLFFEIAEDLKLLQE